MSLSTEGPGTTELTDHTRVTTWGSRQELDNYSNRSFFYVFRTRVRLSANQLYLIETADLRKRDTLQWPAPDTVLYVVNREAGRVLARNDDGYPGSLASQVVLTVAETKLYDIIVRSRTETTVGSLDLVVNGSVVANNAFFAGERFRPTLKAGLIDGEEDCFETDRQFGNPYLYWFPHRDSHTDSAGFVVMNDNGGEGLNAKVCFSDFRRHFPTGDIARGIIVLGSSSASTEGRTDFRISGSQH